MFATGLASLRLTISRAAFSALAGSRLELASGGATEGAMEPSTLPTVKWAPTFRLWRTIDLRYHTCSLERSGRNLGLDKLLVPVVLHVDVNLSTLGLLHQLWGDLTLHDTLKELPEC